MNRHELKHKRLSMLLIPAVAAGALLAADVAAAAALVVRSSGPSAQTYKPGKALPDNAKVALRSGDTLVVLGGDSTRTLKGPGTFALASNDGGAAQAMAGRRGRFSALRTAGIVPRSPTLWHVDVSQSGKVCLADKNNVMLWRPNATQTAMLTVTRPGGAPETQEWPAGQATMAWPSDIPINAGVEYQVKTGDAAPAKLTFATLNQTPTDITSVAEALIAEQCDGQLDLLIETVPAKPTT